MKAWINGPAKRPEKTRDKSVNIEVEVNAAGNIRLDLFDTVEDSRRQTTWITIRLDDARGLRAALDKAIREVEARISGEPITSEITAGDVIDKLFAVAGALHAEDLLQEMLLRSGVWWDCACQHTNTGSTNECESCGASRLDVEASGEEE